MLKPIPSGVSPWACASPQDAAHPPLGPASAGFSPATGLSRTPLPASTATPALVADGKVLRGSAQGESPVVRAAGLWCEQARHSLAQAQAGGREDEALLGLLERMGLEG